MVSFFKTNLRTLENVIVQNVRKFLEKTWIIEDGWIAFKYLFDEFVEVFKSNIFNIAEK